MGIDHDLDHVLGKCQMSDQCSTIIINIDMFISVDHLAFAPLNIQRLKKVRVIVFLYFFLLIL